jgi:large subunit ribosomal protein L15
MEVLEMEGMYTIKKPSSIKRRKRLGCGPSSGKGGTCGRGDKGQLSRSGSGHRPWFEGGQMPLQRRIPKRGFNNIFKEEFQIINLSSIDKLSDKEITADVLKKNKLIKNKNKMIKVLSSGNLTKQVKIYADAFSDSAIEKIKKAGGEAIIREFPAKIETVK